MHQKHHEVILRYRWRLKIKMLKATTEGGKNSENMLRITGSLFLHLWLDHIVTNQINELQRT